MASASTASAATRTWYPCLARMKETRSALAGLSSTTRTVLFCMASRLPSGSRPGYGEDAADVIQQRADSAADLVVHRLRVGSEPPLLLDAQILGGPDDDRNSSVLRLGTESPHELEAIDP